MRPSLPSTPGPGVLLGPRLPSALPSVGPPPRACMEQGAQENNWAQPLSRDGLATARVQMSLHLFTAQGPGDSQWAEGQTSCCTQAPALVARGCPRLASLGSGAGEAGWSPEGVVPLGPGGQEQQAAGCLVPRLHGPVTAPGQALTPCQGCPPGWPPAALCGSCYVTARGRHWAGPPSLGTHSLAHCSWWCCQPGRPLQATSTISSH